MSEVIRVYLSSQEKLYSLHGDSLILAELYAVPSGVSNHALMRQIHRGRQSENGSVFIGAQGKCCHCFAVAIVPTYTFVLTPGPGAGVGHDARYSKCIKGDAAPCL